VTAAPSTSQRQWAWPAWLAYGLARGAQGLFGLLGLVGVVVFLIFVICLYFAFREGAAAPSGEQVVQINNHAHVRYVTREVKHTLDILTRWLFATFFVGTVGYMATEWTAQWLRRRFGPAEPGPDDIIIPPRRARPTNRQP